MPTPHKHERYMISRRDIGQNEYVLVIIKQVKRGVLMPGDGEVGIMRFLHQRYPYVFHAGERPIVKLIRKLMEIE